MKLARLATALTKHPLGINFIDVTRSFDGLHAITHGIRYQYSVCYVNRRGLDN